MNAKGAIGVVVTVVVIGAGVVGGLFVYKKINTLQSQLTQSNEELAECQTRLSNIGEMVTIYKVVRDVKSGNEILQEDLEPIDIPCITAEGYITDINEIVGKYYVVNLKAGAKISDDVIVDYEMASDLRLLDVVVDEMPFGLEAGDYIDLRIVFPDGEDFLVLDKNKVEDINGNTVKLLVRGSDFHSIESAYSDKALYTSTKLYLTQYLQSKVQESSKRYYPINLEALQAMTIDTNISVSNFKDRIKNREELEIRLAENDSVEKAEKYTDGRAEISNKFQEALKVYEAKKAAEEAGDETIVIPQEEEKKSIGAGPSV